MLELRRLESTIVSNAVIQVYTYHNAQLRESLMERLESGEKRFLQRGAFWRKRLDDLSVKVEHCKHTV